MSYSVPPRRLPASETKKHDSETQMCDSETNIYDLETKTWRSPPLTTMLHLELDKRSKPRHPLWSLCCILNLTRDQNPATLSDHYVASWTWQKIKTPPPPMITMLHLELDERSKPHHPLWSLCCILNLTRDQNPVTPSDHYVASWTWQEIKTPPPSLITMLHLELDKRSKPRHPLWSLCCILNLTRDPNPTTPSDHYVASWTWQEIKTPSLPLITMLHLELDKRWKPRHPLWPLCCILNLTRDQNPATPSDHYVASWTWQEIKTPPPPLITMLHLELDKRSKPHHPLWSLCCILNLTRDQHPAAPSDHYVASWTWQEIKTPPPPLITMLHLELDKRSTPRHPLWSLCCILNLTRDQNPANPLWSLCCILNLARDQNPATPSDHYVASWTWQEIKTPQPPLITMLHLELDKRSNPATPSDHYVASWTWQEIKTPPPSLITMLHLELDKRSKPRHPLWSLCCILNLTRDQNPATPSDHYVASWTWQEIKTPPPPLITMLHLELDKRSTPRHPLWSLCCILNLTRDQNPATPSDPYVASWTWQEIKTPPPPLTTMLHFELDKRSKPRHPLSRFFGFRRILGFRRIVFGFRRIFFSFRVIFSPYPVPPKRNAPYVHRWKAQTQLLTVTKILNLRMSSSVFRDRYS